MYIEEYVCASCPLRYPPSACSFIDTYPRFVLITPATGTPPRLLDVDAGAVAVDRELSRSTGEWLGSLLEDYNLVSDLSKTPRALALTDQVLAVDGVSLVLGKVVEEQLDIGVERQLPRAVRRDEAEHGHGPVGALVEIPVEARDVHGGNLVTDGVDTSDACKP
jgi:hypothetical protein